MIKQKIIDNIAISISRIAFGKILSSFIGSKRNWISFKRKLTKKYTIYVLFARKRHVRVVYEIRGLYEYLFQMLISLVSHFCLSIITLTEYIETWFVSKHCWKLCFQFNRCYIIFFLVLNSHVTFQIISKKYSFFHYLLSILMSTRGLCFNYSVVNLASKSKCKLYKKKKKA